MAQYIENARPLCYNLFMNYAKVKAYAKINLTLDILDVAGGYHMLDSVVASIDICDVVTVKKRKDCLVSVTMHGMGSEAIPPDKNNAALAVERFIDYYKTCGADITIHKNIPMGAGLGGSSADVAGVLNALSELYEIEDYSGLKVIADGLGSDCGYMLKGGFARISGRGEKVKPIDTDLRLDIGLLIPEKGVSTAACYALSDRLKSGSFTSNSAENALVNGDLVGLGASLSNGLYPAATRLNPDIEDAYSHLSSFDPVGVNMTGSGSAVYAIFENDQFLSYAHSRNRTKYKFIMTKTIVPKGAENG